MRMKKTMLLTSLSALVIATAGAKAADNDALAAASDGEWLSVTGTVASVSADRFTLDLGKDQVTVEMDDYDWYDEAAVLAGDKVTVTGRTDKDFYEEKKIEASSVYLPSINEYFYVSAADEEDGYYSYPVTSYDLDPAIKDDEWVVLTGTVTEINDEQFKLDTGYRTLTVDTRAMDSSPTDDEGGRLVDVGDRVSVSGEMDDIDLFDTREVEANSVVLLTNNAA